MTNDKLIAQTLAEAEQHRETFKALARDNESIRASLKAKTEEVEKREADVAAREAQVANTAQAQTTKAAELARLEQALKDEQLAIQSDRDSFESKKQAGLDALTQREQAVRISEQNLESARIVFNKEQLKAKEAQAAKDAEQQDRETRLRAGESRLQSDGLKLEEDRRTYKAKVKEEVTAELLQNVTK